MGRAWVVPKGTVPQFVDSNSWAGVGWLAARLVVGCARYRRIAEGNNVGIDTRGGAEGNGAQGGFGGGDMLRRVSRMQLNELCFGQHAARWRAELVEQR